MTIRTTDTKQVITIELRVWDGTQWGPDCFGDLECNFASSYETDSFCNVIAPKADVDALISWWENEISNANTIPDYEGDGLSSDWQGREYSLFVDVEPDIASIV